jgi:serine protease Do
MIHSHIKSRLLPALFAAALLASVSAAPAQDKDENLVALQERAMRAAVERVAPSVVKIETIGGKPKVGDVLIGVGPTTGLVVDSGGYIISSAFNFAQDPGSILVTLPGGERKPAQIVARDNSRMLVLLKVETDQKLAVPQAAPDDSARVGQWAIAVGRTFGDEPNMSIGIVSAVDRMFGRAIQTDAKISPSNYGGPLLDIHGRVLGVLVPMSPRGDGEVAGVEWYDSGIGFAVPLTTIFERLPQLKAGQDLEPGVLGIALAGGDPYALPAKIAAARPNSPAAAAGLREGDIIVAVNGRPVATQMQFKIQLGRLYAGDAVKLVALRGEERTTYEVELVGKLPPFEHAFLGLLPTRPTSGDEQPKGVAVRYVYPDSPAAKAGIQAGDLVTKIGGEAVETRADAVEALAAFIAGNEIEVEYARDGKTKTAKLTAASLPTAIPDELPPAREKLEPPADPKVPIGASEARLPGFKNPYRLYVPENYHPDATYGVVVWLHGPGGAEEEQVVARWKPLCKQRDLIFVAPGSDAPNQWSRTEADYVARVLAAVTKTYNVDPARVVLHGYQAGGAMAYLVGLRDREHVAAVAAIDAPLPSMLELPENDPLRRLAVFTASSDQSRFADRIAAGVEELKTAKYPVTALDLGGPVRYLKPEELVKLARWIDTLDRF